MLSGKIGGVTRTGWWLAAGLLLPPLLAVALYLPALDLPLFFDTLLHIQLARNLDLVTVWLPTEAFGYYRPFLFLPFLISRALFDGYSNILFHTLSVMQHALNAFLLAALVWRLWRRRFLTLGAGLLFAVYPFSYQAIIFFGNNIYPATVNLILLALHSYLAALRRGGRRWWLLTGLLFIAGLLSHEMTILFGPLAALVHLEKRVLALRSQIGRWRLSLARQPFLSFVAAGLLYAIIYPLLPTGSSAALATEGTMGLLPRLLYLAQSAAYPFAWFAHLLPTVPAHLLVGAAVTLTVVLALVAATHPAYRRPLLFGWGWWLLASALIGLTLSTNYLLHGPRLLYLGSLGSAIAWAAMLEALAAGAPHRGRMAQWMATVLFMFILAISALFVRDRLQATVEITAPVTLMKEVMANRPAREGVVLVNTPAWTSPPRNYFAVGVEFVTLLGEHLFAAELVNANLGTERPVIAVVAPQLLGTPDYPYGLYEQAVASRVESSEIPNGAHFFITYYRPEGVRAAYTGQILPPGPQQEPLAIFGPYRLRAAEVNACSAETSVLLEWERGASGEQVATRSVFVQQYGADAQPAGQADGPPLGIPPGQVSVPPSWRFLDRRHLPPVTSGEGHILLGVYDYLSGERTAATDSAGNPLPNNALRLPLTPCP